MKWLRRALVLVPAIWAIRVDDDEDVEDVVESADANDIPGLGSMGGGHGGAPAHPNEAPAKRDSHMAPHHAGNAHGDKVSEHGEPGKEGLEHHKGQVESAPGVSSGSKHSASAGNAASKR
eukprot:TRINITY_DN40641_c0_g1_i1.p1 TRINITY_DN40641_c0_g1~~TRINITY_DN40641_c0_g1_i1.p1  ORF type:complete len:120 (+),score=31.73 TRINITY_DN40641_c0_g1_i1:133-492(+)